MRLATPPGLAGVAVARFEDDERDAVLACLRGRAGRPFRPDGGPAPRLAALHLADRVLDEVLVVDRCGRGFELHLHGSPAVVAALRARFPERSAAGPPGPADALLRTALSVEQLDLALEQRAADFAAFVAELASRPPPSRAAAVRAALLRSQVAMAHVEPHRVVLVGAQNAGKSTLFNRLLFRERALTGPEPGLTRDPVREVTALAGYPIELVDTAGEGDVAAAVDMRALRAGRGLRAGATLLLVVDRCRGPSASDRGLAAAADVLVVANKADLPAGPWPADLPVAAVVAAAAGDPVELRGVIGAALRLHRGLPRAGPVGGPAALDADGLAALRALAI